MKTTKALLTLAFVTVAFAGQASAIAPTVTPLLLIDDTDPSNITITATSYNPFLFRSDSSHTFNDGIDLLNFFAPNSLDGQFFDVSGTLTTGFDGTPYYNTGHSDNITGDSQDLNIFTGGFAVEVVPDPSNTTENFDVNTPAFAGTAILDLGDSSFASELLPVGTIGSIFAGFSDNVSSSEGPTDLISSDNVLNGYVLYIGDYEIVPEPSQWSLLLLGAAGLLIVRRFRASRA